MQILNRITSKLQHAIFDIKHIFSKDVLIFYWRGANDQNFGDQLNVDLIRYYGFQPVPCAPGKAEVFAIGSILHRYAKGHDGIVAGSGYIKPPQHITINPKNTIALRGPKTNSYFKKDDIPLCDPGILAKRIFGSFSTQHQIGIVPHFRDQDDPQLLSFLNNHPAIKLIDVLQKPEAVVREIAQCETILSSSLHGLVVADSYNIPAVWINFDDRQEGGEFKYLDYHGSLGIERRRISLGATPDLGMLLDQAVTVDPRVTDQKIMELERAFSTLRHRLIILRIHRVFKAVLSTIMHR
ncbi:hypothetical protein Tel_13590 [Candidatus Tenderia electrophaga]|uniref:Polysaccharide pyruvyl transferase domain-containing protein n=1 Tax=Candidatus Tenderia electrophaga TaxID=1748243 RepID=A0A0S2TFY6_9GAMM|nr:hypothetical protein Tel_13590 [Candidatus Tenderia electrophaga]